jgi:hypothetical protein
MTEQELKELNERLAINVLNIKKIHYEEWDIDKQFPMYIPSGKPWRTHQIDARPIPNFTSSMDTCIKWIVPILKQDGVFTILFDYITNGVHCSLLGDEKVSVEIGETESLAFCLAAIKYFSEVKK